MEDRTSYVDHDSGLYSIEGHKSGLKDHDTYFGEGTKY